MRSGKPWRSAASKPGGGSSTSIGRGLRHLLSWPLALLILFEEWGWEPLQRALARLAQWEPLQRLERRIAGLGPGAALALFALPALALLPIKVAALWLIAGGQR